jgi:hypothetical protein
MKIRITGVRLLATILIVSALETTVQASIISWAIDSAQSYLTLSIPQQKVNITDTVSATVRLVNQSGGSSWTSGNKAPIAGTLTTNYFDGLGINILSANAVGLNTGNYRPNHAVWDAGTETYANNTTAPAVFGAKAQAQVLFFLDAGYISITDVLYNLTSDGLIPISGGSFASTATNFGIQSAEVGLQGLNVLGLAQVPSFQGAIGGLITDNTAGLATITTPDPINNPYVRKLTLPLKVNVAIQQGDLTLTGSASGQIVATAFVNLVPEPTTYVLALTACVAALPLALRRHRRH